jgi:hypothetical protein
MPDISVDGIRLPTQRQLDEASATFDEEWGEVDKVLYAVCREHQKHEERRHVTAKVALVGRAYQAGLERCITPGPGQQAVMVGADYIWKRGADVDDIIAAVLLVSEPLTAASGQELVEHHGRFTQLLGEMPECNRLPRSFASKYLHFHHPVVPIYDSYAAESLGKQVRWSQHSVAFAKPPHGDAFYWDYCVRLFRVYDACRDHGRNVTMKTLDSYLWAVPS